MNRVLSILFFALLFLGCAQQVPPSGGAKDTTPPKIIASVPKNYSTNVYTKQIVFEFDEFVKQKALISELLVSPPLKKNPEFEFKGKRFFMTLFDTLKPNVTYQFNFGDGLVDITEGNPLDSNLFVFSTGDYLDSLSIEGTIKKAFDLSPEEDVLVMLYKSTNDSIVCKQKPLYYTKTNKDGKFKLQFLAHGSYQIFALVDNNANFLYDLPNERISFLNAPLLLNKDTTVNLFTFEEKIDQQFVKSLELLGHHKLLLKLNQPSENIQLNVIGKYFKRPWYFLNESKKSDSIIAWVESPQILDTASIEVLVDHEVLDTVKLIFADTPKKKVILNAQEFDKKQISHSPYDSLFISFNLPVLSVDTAKVSFKLDSLSTSFSLEKVPASKNKLLLVTNWAEESEYHLNLLPGAIKTFYDTLNTDTLNLKIKTKKESDFGTLSLSVSGYPNQNLLIQVFNQSKTSLYTQRALPPKNRTLQLQHVPVAKYALKVIFDENLNFSWDAGSYGKSKQPEKVIWYEGAVELQNGFDSEIKWELAPVAPDSTKDE